MVDILKKRYFQVQVPLFKLGMYECLANAGSSEGDLLCVVGSLGQNSEPREPQEATCDCDKQMLYVQEK